MIASLCLLGGLLAPGQLPQRPIPALPALSPLPAGRGGAWTLSPQLTRAQELVYRGTFREEATGSQVQFNRGYRLELRVFVMEAGALGYETAFLTLLKSRETPRAGAPASGISETSACSARLEMLQLDLQGQLRSEANVSLNVPLEGAPTLECGLFVPAPKERIGMEQDWQVSPSNRPPHTWRIAGTEMVAGNSCLKLVGAQQSDDWDRPRADRTAWRRQDTVWMVARLGYASRVERTIELREPAHREPTQRSVIRYDLESSLSYPGPLYETRRQEIRQALAFADSAAPLLPLPQKYGPQLGYLLTKISNHLDKQAPTPYREAVLQVRRRVEAAQRGETPPAVAPETLEDRPATATLGFPAPDFVTTQFTDQPSLRLRSFQGRPVLLVFYNPTAQTAEQVLTYAQHLSNAHAGRLTVLPCSILEDPQPALKQRTALGVTLPILSGGGLRISYDIETTPKMILIDASGIVRGSYLGWGRETPAEIADELKNWLSALGSGRSAGRAADPVRSRPASLGDREPAQFTRLLHLSRGAAKSSPE